MRNLFELNWISSERTVFLLKACHDLISMNKITSPFLCHEALNLIILWENHYFI
jgi:hypothetical protein